MLKTKRLRHHINYFIIFLIVLTIGLLFINKLIVLDDEKQNSDTLLFLGNKNNAPICYIDKGTTKGVAVDIAKELGKHIGYNIEVRGVNWSEAQDMVLLDEADALLQINSNSERENVYDFSDELLQSEFCIFVKSGDIRIRKHTDLKNKVVGIESGGYTHELLNQYEGVQTEIVNDWREGFRDIVSGKLDAIVVDRWVGEYELAEGKIQGIKIIDMPIQTQYSRIAVKKGNKELLDLINTGLEAINEDGTMDHILSKWEGKRVVYFTKDSLITTVLCSIIVILCLIIIISQYWISKLSNLSNQLEDDVKQRTKELYHANTLLQKANAELERISMKDELTTLYNRRYFDSALLRIWESPMKERKSMAVLMIDIDNFKLLNDTYGHLAGDRCLKSIAKEIKHVAKRKNGIAARLGGEEFVVILSNTTEETASYMAEKMRMKIESLGIVNEKINSVVTVSIGVAAVIPNKNMHPEELIDEADRTLYYSKTNGKNRVVRLSSLRSYILGN